MEWTCKAVVLSRGGGVKLESCLYASHFTLLLSAFTSSVTASLASTHEPCKNITYTFYRLYADTFLSNCYRLTFVSCVQRSGSFSCILAKSNLCFLFLSETRIVCEHRDFTFTNMSLDCRLTMICLPVRVRSWFWKFGSLDHWNNYVIILPMNFRSPITFNPLKMEEYV